VLLISHGYNIVRDECLNVLAWGVTAVMDVKNLADLGQSQPGGATTADEVQPPNRAVPARGPGTPSTNSGAVRVLTLDNNQVAAYFGARMPSWANRSRRSWYCRSRTAKPRLSKSRTLT
jgi:hypothetical protein